MREKRASRLTVGTWRRAYLMANGSAGTRRLCRVPARRVEICDDKVARIMSRPLETVPGSRQSCSRRHDGPNATAR